MSEASTTFKPVQLTLELFSTIPELKDREGCQLIKVVRLWEVSSEADNQSFFCSTMERKINNQIIDPSDLVQ